MEYTKTNLQNGPSSFSRAYYNGNISSAHWKTANDSEKYGYLYEYDVHDRLSGSVFFIGNVIQLGMLSESFSFDKNGNITGGFRENHQGGTVDYLQYTYDSGNKLLKVVDLTGNPEGFKEGINSGNDYAYDIDGNMTQDLNKGITDITYNHLNLPTQITVVQGGQTSTTQMVYTAGGSKLSKTTTVNSIPKTTQYAGAFVYTDTNTYPEYIHFSEGYIEPSGTSSEVEKYTYIYQYTDHLGNVRLSYADDNGDGTVDVNEIREEKHYYPFGLQHNYGSSDPRSVKRGRPHKYGFNGIELNEDLGVDLYEMPLRSYDPAIGRWTAQDPVVHHMYSPYSAFDNNPVYYADPSGADSYSSAQDYFANYNMISNVPLGNEFYARLLSNSRSGYTRYENDGSGNFNQTDYKTFDELGFNTQRDFKNSGFVFEEGLRNSFKQNIINSYNKVFGLELGKIVLRVIANSGSVFTIDRVTSASSQGIIPENIGTKEKPILSGNATLNISDAIATVDGIHTNGLFNFAHEVFHAFQLALGSDHYIGLTNSFTSNGVRYSEVQAVGFENYVRGSINQSSFNDMRSIYDGRDIIEYRKNFEERNSVMQFIFGQKFDNWTADDFIRTRRNEWFYMHEKYCRNRCNN
ncbi:RHS repeat domain-containing protein [Aquimarina sp. AU119]|uniref:RHS repeat domain-containing protein n=1 Tax=Aquimarina sp. AU119 TaxID=2108528 RepID=UPI000D68D1FA|nr:RHS repeat-associated core domain-containing protein [Aquimarina sp. AU119]